MSSGPLQYYAVTAINDDRIRRAQAGAIRGDHRRAGRLLRSVRRFRMPVVREVPPAPTPATSGRTGW